MRKISTYSESLFGLANTHNDNLWTAVDAASCVLGDTVDRRRYYEDFILSVRFSGDIVKSCLSKCR